MRILVYHKALFALSETFIHRQVKSLQEEFSIYLLASRFDNDEMFPVKASSRMLIEPYTNVFDRFCSKAYRLFFSKQLPFSLGSNRKIEGFILRNKIDVIHAHYGWSGL